MSDAMDHDVREVIRRRIELRERDGHERLLLNHDALRALLDAADERDQLAAAVARMRAMADDWAFRASLTLRGGRQSVTVTTAVKCILRALDGADDEV